MEKEKSGAKTAEGMITELVNKPDNYVVKPLIAFVMFGVGALGFLGALAFEAIPESENLDCIDLSIVIISAILMVIALIINFVQFNNRNLMIYREKVLIIEGIIKTLNEENSKKKE